MHWRHDLQISSIAWSTSGQYTASLALRSLRRHLYDWRLVPAVSQTQVPMVSPEWYREGRFNRHGCGLHLQLHQCKFAPRIIN